MLCDERVKHVKDSRKVLPKSRHLLMSFKDAVGHIFHPPFR